MEKVKLKTILMVLILLIFSSLSRAATKDLEIFIPSQVKVLQGEIRLADLAKLSGGDLGLVKQIGAIKLGRAPLAGEKRIFTRKYLKLLLQERLSQYLWELEMPDQVVVEATYITITAEKIKTAISEKLLPSPVEWQSWLELSNLPSTINIAATEYEIKATPLSKLTKLGRVLFKIELITDGKVKQSLNISGRLRAKGIGYQALRTLIKGKVLEEHDFKVVSFELHSGREIIGKLPSGYRITQTMRAGMSLTSDRIETIPLIAKGSEVKVVVVDDAFELKTMAIAQSDGWVDQWIKLTNPLSHKTFLAKVIAPNTAEVRLK